MSLIDDALKRAAEAGTRRDAEKAPARPWTPPPLPERRRGIRLWMIVVILGMAAGVAWLSPWTPRQSEVIVPDVPVAAPTPAVMALPAAAETALPSIEPTRAPTRRPPPAAAAPGAAPPETAAAQEAAPAPAEAPRPPGPAGITLEGIVWSQDDPVAMINGRILRVGAVVEGYTLTKIETDAVELQGEKGTIRLRVGSAP